MKRQSYKIKHDFLFDGEDTDVTIPKSSTDIFENNEIRLSDVLKAKDENSFNKLFKDQLPNIIIDDIGKCDNPASERYKQFILRCIFHKLIKRNISVYF